jgi:hypothetical protein
MSKTRKKRSKAARNALTPAQSYLPTQAEQKTLTQLIERIEQAPAHALAKVEVRDGSICLGWRHENQVVAGALWAGALGTTDFAFAGMIFEQLAQLARRGETIDEKDFNGMLTLVRNLAPADPVEGMLAVQMCAVHTCTMTAARRLMQAETRAEQESHSISFNKLARTFTTQIEALKRYRQRERSSSRT